MPRAAPLLLLAIVMTSQPPPGTRTPKGVATVAEHPPVTGTDGAACTSCHAGVTAGPVVHGPVAAGQCSTCHVVANTPGRRRVTLKSGASARNTAALCLTCHEDTAERLRQPHRHAPVAAGDCGACHDPHGSSFRFQLPAEGNRACTTCHEDIAQALAQSHVHAPAAESCQICHDPHAASGPAQLRAPGNKVCVVCHVGTDADAQAVDVRGIFGRHPPADLDRLIADGRRIRLDASLSTGHPTIAHPVGDRQDPRVKGRTLGCASCHNPHGSPGAKLFRFRAASVSALCVECHSF